MQDNDKKQKNNYTVNKVLVISLCGTIAIIFLLLFIVLIQSKNNDKEFIPAIASGASELAETFSSAVEEAIIGEEGKVYTVSEGDIRDIIEINQLSTIEYTYNSIVKAYSDDKKKPILRYSASYNGTITAGIDFSKVIIDVDEENRIVTITVPDAEIQKTIVDAASIDYIFTKEKYNTETVGSEAYSLAYADLENKSKENNDILPLAKENAISAIEALLEPWLSQIENGYTVNVS